MTKKEESIVEVNWKMVIVTILIFLAVMAVPIIIAVMSK